jgi:hypothetical protein
MRLFRQSRLPPAVRNKALHGARITSARRAVLLWLPVRVFNPAHAPRSIDQSAARLRLPRPVCPPRIQTSAAGRACPGHGILAVEVFCGIPTHRGYVSPFAPAMSPSVNQDKSGPNSTARSDDRPLSASNGLAHAAAPISPGPNI